MFVLGFELKPGPMLFTVFLCHMLSDAVSFKFTFPFLSLSHLIFLNSIFFFFFVLCYSTVCDASSEYHFVFVKLFESKLNVCFGW